MTYSARYSFYLFCSFACFSLAHAQIDDRILGGQHAMERQFPYLISLQLNGRQHRCGGGIIGERFVLTAAHCVTDMDKQFDKARFMMVADTIDINDLMKGRTVDVETIYIPKTYWQSIFKDDIAVLKLKQDIGLANGLRKLDLPRDGQNYVGQTAQIAGFGYFWIKAWGQGGSTDYKLKYLDVNIIANDRCQIESGTFPDIYDTNICGQAVQQLNGRQNPAGICNGDSGGPLVINNTIIGIASLGTLRCEESVAFSRYTRVSSFVKFIDNVMRGLQTVDMRIHNSDGTDGTQGGIAFPDDRK